MNMKFGGDNHWLDEPKLEILLSKRSKKQSTMALGADVTHPGSSSKVGTPSIACVMGTVDSRFMSYRGSIEAPSWQTRGMYDISHGMNQVNSNSKLHSSIFTA